LAIFVSELLLLVVAGFPLAIAEIINPDLTRSRAVAMWQGYHVFFHHQGEWFPVLVLAAALVGGCFALARVLTSGRGSLDT